jgi:hypothetical protein
MRLRFFAGRVARAPPIGGNTQRVPGRFPQAPSSKGGLCQDRSIDTCLRYAETSLSASHFCLPIGMRAECLADTSIKSGFQGARALPAAARAGQLQPKLIELGRKKVVSQYTGPRLIRTITENSLHNPPIAGHSTPMSHAQHSAARRAPAGCVAIPTHGRWPFRYEIAGSIA